ncbi:long-chain-fatty-acid--CoA ligase [Natrononativus amylolyticus]|uniref:long-chain-fatty-acid--CoA ligase n=1 Tax=Natrononativus amylolyticus TaxID=2963434 RepID=UPI0020CD5ADE|nr:long-chain-fatty-acid--CoA ligase [Natrononativus amylolyticus]
MNVPNITPHFLDRAVEYYGDVVGVIADDGTEFTYDEFGHRVNRLSNALLDLGLEEGNHVAIVSQNTHWCLETLYAVQQLGMVFVPLNYRLIESDYQYLLSDSEADAVLVDYEFAEKVDPVRDDVPADQFICYKAERAKGSWTDYDELIEGASKSQPDRPDIQEDDEATINYTSGTTGPPKGVVRTHRTNFSNAITHALNVQLKDDTVYLWTLPMFHVEGWSNMYTITGVGGTHVCFRDFSAEAAFERIREYNVSYLSGAPTVLNRLLEYNEETDDLVTAGENSVTISTAAASPPRATIEAIEDDLGWDLYHFYGHTESGPYTTSYSPRRIDSKGRVAVKTKQGIPSIGNEMRVVDKQGNDVPRDDETMGEIVLKGNLVFDRYWNKPQKTEEAFSDRVDGWFHSGDLGTIDENGFVTIKDRKKDVIISGGENISTLEVEDAIYDIPDVVRATVIPVPHDEWGETPKALIITRNDSKLTESDVITHCKDKLASFKAPTSVEFVNDLPETSTGKIKKHELREKYWEDEDQAIGSG